MNVTIDDLKTEDIIVSLSNGRTALSRSVKRLTSQIVVYAKLQNQFKGLSSLVRVIWCTNVLHFVLLPGVNWYATVLAAI